MQIFGVLEVQTLAGQSAFECGNRGGRELEIEVDAHFFELIEQLDALNFVRIAKFGRGLFDDASCRDGDLKCALF